MPDTAPGAPALDLSIVVVAHNMARELPRTLTSLSHAYQRDLGDLAYEVLVMDNGSDKAISASSVSAIDPCFRLHRIDDAPPSPAFACNSGVAMTSGRTVAIIVDGARLVTPGALSQGMRALATHPRAIVTALAWHLGPAHQSVSTLSGYGPAAEDALLATIGWPEDGYRLFDICTLAGANPGGFLGSVTESCFLMVPRELWDEVGGVDDAFNAPGGGLAALDLFTRLISLPETQPTILLGEGSFHQVHGGATTAPGVDLAPLFAQYEDIRGTPYAAPTFAPTYFGRMADASRRWLNGAPQPEARRSPRRLPGVARRFAGRVRRRLKR